MRPAALCALAALAGALPVFAQESPADPAAAGKALAQQLRDAGPEQNSEAHGVLHMRRGDMHRDAPISVKVNLGDHPGDWRATYEAGGTNWVVVHSSSGPNQYLWGPTNAAPARVAGAAALAIAGSDFSLDALGWEFLDWPQQQELKGQMRLGQPCHVLESADPGREGVERVRSFIDRQSGGVIEAEAYDARGRLVKEFSLRGSFFKKVNGQWRLEKMEMEDFKNNSRTVLDFDMVK